MKQRKNSWLTVAAPWVLGLILLAGWFLTTAGGRIPSYRLPTPIAVGKELWDGLVVYADFWAYILVTLSEALGGALLGFLVALPLAVIIYRSKIASAATLPFLGATQAIPAIALAPLLVLWVGYSVSAKIVLCALMVFFPILVSSVVGFRHLDPEILGAAKVDGAGSLATLFSIEIPLAMPNILAGVRNGFTLSVTGAVVGEMVMGGTHLGLGSLLTAQVEALNTARLISIVLILAFIATTMYTIVSIIERRWSNLTKPLTQGESQ
ncbi:MAG: ABC transporter permease [Propionibacteriaceae bacterium]|nr:ABC transporter permease [Propionibacteriaceae bacterium]